MTSLLYLREEAERDGLQAVAKIMWEALAAMERWLDSGQAPVGSHDILDSPLCHSLDFLLKWLSLPAESQRRVARNIADYETDFGPDTAMPRPRRRLSKKTAS